MRRFAGLGTLLLGGCQVVFPLRDDTPPPEPPETPTVNVMLRSHHVENTPAGDPMFVDRELGGGFATVFFEDRTSIEVDIGETGAFSFGRPTQHYRIRLSYDLDVFEVQDDAETLVISYETAGRTATPLASRNSLIQTPEATGAKFTLLASTGQWSNPQVINSLVDWNDTTGIGNLPLGLVSGAQGDRLYFLEFSSALGVDSISKFIVQKDAAMASGQMLVMNGVAEPTIPSCTTVSVMLPDELQEFEQATAVFEPPYVAVSAGWQLKAQPTLEIGNLAQLTIAQSSDALPNLSFAVDAPYINPIEKHVVVATAGMAGVREITHPNALLAKQVFAGTEHVDAAPPGACPASTTVLDQPIGFPVDVELDGVRLAKERSIALPRQGTSPLTWTTTDHPVDYYDITLLEVGIDTSANTTLTQIGRYRTREPQLEVTNSDLVVGHHYLFVIKPALGAPDAATGDYAHREYPLANAALPTAMFTVE